LGKYAHWVNHPGYATPPKGGEFPRLIGVFEMMTALQIIYLKIR
jgi:hypothetical protein